MALVPAALDGDDGVMAIGDGFGPQCPSTGRRRFAIGRFRAMTAQERARILAIDDKRVFEFQHLPAIGPPLRLMRGADVVGADARRRLGFCRGLTITFSIGFVSSKVITFESSSGRAL
jgi:hypothetical protein